MQAMRHALAVHARSAEFLVVQGFLQVVRLGGYMVLLALVSRSQRRLQVPDVSAQMSIDGTFASVELRLGGIPSNFCAQVRRSRGTRSCRQHGSCFSRAW